jgi:ribosomal-protein-alanine N-acetyltransferase
VNVLALDGAFGAFSAAVAVDGAIVATKCESGSVALERGLPIVDAVLAAANLRGERIDRLAVGVGPGSFTGLRIAIAYAKALAAVWQRPLLPIDSFDLLEFGGCFDRVLSVVVGRPGVISARYRSGSEARRASGWTADALAQVLPEGESYPPLCPLPPPPRWRRRCARRPRVCTRCAPTTASSQPRSRRNFKAMKMELERPAERPGGLSIAPMATPDIAAVARIERGCFSTVWPSDAFYNELSTNKLAHYFVGRFQDRIVGYGGIWVILEDSHITTLAVDPEYRGRRFGEILLLRLIDEAIERGAAWMTLEVRESNTIAQQLYRKYGFTTVTMRSGYYSDDNESALIMWAGSLKSELYRNRLRVLRARVEA